ncbi:AbrB/MazE/SpoVT family DNA-binding domain-containing protein [Candidatus Woesearchaeota archaeon]|nr:AbrB/MazE/SpoVT family DNA-binding domain-containing protein [Candidatus Woesearchaeota archaeon]
MIDIKTATITSKGQIALPKEIREETGFKEGDKVAVVSYEDRIEIRPMWQVKERIETAYASEKSLAKDWLVKEEDKAWKDL